MPGLHADSRRARRLAESRSFHAAAYQPASSSGVAMVTSSQSPGTLTEGLPHEALRARRRSAPRDEHRVCEARVVGLRERVSALLGAEQADEVPGGHQSRAFEATLPDGQRVVVKVLDAGRADRADVERRVEVVAELARSAPQVCAPLAIRGHLVNEIEGRDGRVGLATCVEHAGGTPPRVDRSADAELMGRALARLHHAMAALGPTGLPPVAALAAVPFHGDGAEQLLHGDFGAGNLRITDGRVRIFDLDDCGQGPPLFDVANALYMVLFDDLTTRVVPCFEAFAAAFLSGYGAVKGVDPERAELDRFVDLRVAVLERWLDDPSCAPIGIRTSPPQWHATLREFIDAYRARPT